MGRPPKSLHNSLRKEMHEWLGVMRAARELAETQVERWGSKLGEMPVNEQVQILGALRDLVNAAVRVVDSGNKNLENMGESQDSETLEDIQENLLK